MRWIPAFFLLVACATPLDSAHFAVTTPQSAGVVAFLNDPATTFEILDDEVPLDRRAATNLMAARPFDSLEEVDAVSWVGPAAIAALTAYADANGYVPGPNQVLGTWDDVEFTVAQAELVLEIVVNDLEFHDFDIYIGLDSRAATSIVNAQPVGSIDELASLYYVGTSALTKLKAYGAEMMGDEWPSCVPVFTPAANADAADLTELLALSTTVDNPWAEVTAFASTGCSDWWLDPGFHQPLWDEIFFLSWSQSGDLATVGAPVGGGQPYLSMLDLSLVVIEERIDDGDWDPADAQELYDSRFDLVEGLSLDLDTNPGAFLTVTLDLDLIECSEEATALIDTRDGSVIVAHQLQNC